ncbi:MAG: HAMP domain-containing histidine kinase [Flavobacteriales bacterium]|nr:HAMP domain-containing histidine kinase [Flavobacteriales bacterium]
MNAIKKILPNVLVISSISCLVVFLVIWNIHQYEQAESSLKKELSFYLESSNNSVHQRQLSSFIKRLDINISSDQRTNYIPSKGLDTLSRIVVWVDSLGLEEGEEFRLKTDRKTNFFDNIDSSNFVKYRTLIKRLPSGSKNMAFPERISGLDLFTLESTNRNSKETERVLSIFEEKLKENDLPSDFFQPNDSMVLSSQNLPIEYESSSMFGTKKTLYFQNYTTYLFSKIASSILFSLCLLTLVVIAFIVVMRSLKQQKRMVEIKNDFISNMTHELKTPISTVSVAIEAIRKYDVIKDRAKTEEYLDISSNELGRLSLLVEKVLRSTLFESGNGFLNLQPVDLSLIVKDTLHTMQMHFEERKVSLSTDLVDTSLWVMGDKVHLTNVVYNLIENAIKYSGDSIEIAVCTKKEGAKAMFSIADKGIGIPTEHQKYIFTKFYRVPNHDRHNVKGYGLGLSYVKQVIDELEGSIDLESQQGIGTKFSIHLKMVEA